MKTFFAFAALLSLPTLAFASAGDDLNVSSIDCMTNTGIAIQGRDSGKREYGSNIVLSVRTTWFGVTKDFLGSSYFSVKPEGELTVTLRTADASDNNGLYFLRGFVDTKDLGSQNVSLALLQPGYAGFNSPGEHLTVGEATCQIKLTKIR